MTELEKIYLKNRKTSLRSSTHKITHKRQTSLWLMLVIIILTALVFLFPQFHFEKTIDTKGIWWFDVIQHIVFFFFFCIILFKLLPLQKLTVSFFIFIFLFSAFFEVLQKLFYNSNFSYQDTASNFIGILFAFIIYSLANQMKMKPKKRRHFSVKKKLPE